jgi:Icc-related predicted phosphoesterase
MKRIFSLLMLLFSLSTVSVYAQTESAVTINPAQNVREVCGPCLQNVTKTSFTVVWTTNMDAVGWVEIAPDDGTDWENVDRPKYYDDRGLGRKPIEKVHKVTVTGLQPGTRYRYRIMMKGVLYQNNRSGIIYTSGYGLSVDAHPTYVTTLSDSYDKLKIGVVNDMHEHDSVLRADFRKAKGRYDFVVFNGDMTSTIDNENDIVTNYLKSASQLFAAWTPLYIVRGNHEYRGNDALKWYNYLATPTGKTYYTFHYGKFFFIVLDGGEDKNDNDIRNLDIMCTENYVKEEAQWLKEVVKSDDFKNAETRVVFCHMPPDQKGWHGSRMIADYLVPTLNEAGVDIMLCAHIHEFHYYKVGDTNADFPIVCNTKETLMEVDMDRSDMTLTFYGYGQTPEKTLKFPLGTFKK